jgi:hypothetical protein
MTLKEKIEAYIESLEEWRDNTYEEEVIDLAEYSIEVLKEIIKEVYADY